MTRYDNLTLALRGVADRGYKSLRYMEIGTYDGVRAAQLLKGWLADDAVRKAWYYGFDLFEDLTPEMRKSELSKSKLPPSLADVNLYMSEILPWRVNFALFKGNTRETLPREAARLPKMDVIFQDGGHSLETAENDWEHARHLMGVNTVYLMDDYYLNRNDYGVQTLAKQIDAGRWGPLYVVTPLDPIDRVEHTNLDIRMVKVTLKG